MANLHNSFSEYNGLIRLSDDMRNELIIARDKLRERIEVRYRSVQVRSVINEILEFLSQGSFVMDTIIHPVHDDYDLDDGLYFIGSRSRDQRPSPEILHQLVVDAIGSDWGAVVKVIDKNTCARVIFKKGFHIDIPIYYAGDKKCPDLADKKKGFILSNPIEFIAWFEAKVNSGFKSEFLYESTVFGNEYNKWLTDIRKADHQLRRLVRYLKSWGDLRREEMPCGLVMTILVANHYYSHQRDDIALTETLVLIHSALSRSFRCERPTTPEGEDLLAGYPHKAAFLKYLQNFIDVGKQAMSEPDAKKACANWQKVFGDRFPCDIVIEQKPSVSVAALAAGASLSKPWSK